MERFLDYSLLESYLVSVSTYSEISSDTMLCETSPIGGPRAENPVAL